VFGIGIRFAQNLIGFCKRFGLFLTATIITFAYNLMAILEGLAQLLFPGLGKVLHARKVGNSKIFKIQGEGG
jgi:hypothetical protein